MTFEKNSVYLSEMWKTSKCTQARVIAFQKEKKLMISESFFKYIFGIFYTREENLKKKN